MQEFTDSIKRPNLRIMGIEEEEVQAKGIHNIFNKIIQKTSQIYRKLYPLRYRKPLGHHTDLTKIELHHDILLKQQAQRIVKEY
jgi:hypothetical protein